MTVPVADLQGWQLLLLVLGGTVPAYAIVAMVTFKWLIIKARRASSAHPKSSAPQTKPAPSPPRQEDTGDVAETVRMAPVRVPPVRPPTKRLSVPVHTSGHGRHEAPEAPDNHHNGEPMRSGRLQ